MPEKIEEWLLAYYRDNLIASVYHEAHALRRLLNIRLVGEENRRRILVELPFGMKKVFIDFKIFPPVGKNVAVIGSGMIARAVHIPALISIGAIIQYIVDPDEKRAAMAADSCGARALRDAKELKNSQIDYAVICAPPKFHPELARSVMRMGFDCFVEKPIALTVHEAEEMVKESERTGKKLLVGHMRHWDTDYDPIMDLAKAGNCLISRRCLQSAPLWRGKECKDYILEDGVVHDLDLLRVWAGDPLRFRVITRKQDHFVARLVFKSIEAEINDQWVGTYTKFSMPVELARQIMNGTFYNKIWEVKSSDSKRLLYYHEKDRIPLIAYQGEHYDILASHSKESLKYKPEDALSTMKLVAMLSSAPMDKWVEYKK